MHQSISRLLLGVHVKLQLPQKPQAFFQVTHKYCYSADSTVGWRTLWA